MNKRGISLEFLVTVLLALLIFIPTCYGVSKYFRLSSQAVDNFKSMAADIEDLAKNGQEGERRSAVVILDTKSFMALFAGQEKVIFSEKSTPTETSTPEGVLTSTVVTQHFAEPPSACTSYPCFCLCREFTKSKPSGTTTGETIISSINAQCTRWNCRVLEGVTVAESWGIGRLTDKDVRRQAVTLEKQGGKVRVVSESLSS